MVTCSNGGPGQSCDFIDPRRRQETIEDHLAFVRDFLTAFGCRHVKINLGGDDPLEMIRTYDRLAALHWKDTKPHYRGDTGPTPTIEQHRQEILYKDLGTGGVDLPGIWAFLQERGYQGWITLDLDPPRPNEGEGSVEAKIRKNRGYVLEVLRIASL